MKYRLQVLTLLLVPFIGCRNNEPAEPKPRLFGDFFVRFLAEGDGLKAQVSFYEGISLETAIPRTMPGGVIFQGSAMQPRDLQGQMIRYSISREAAYSEAFPFRFQALDGKWKEYLLSMTPVQDFFVKGDISRSRGMTLIVNGGLLRDNEKLVLLFSDDQNRASSITLDGPTANIELFLPPEKLQDLKAGPGQLYLVKKQSDLVERPEISLTSSIEYYTKTIAIDVKE